MTGLGLVYFLCSFVGLGFFFLGGGWWSGERRGEGEGRDVYFF